MLAGDLYIADDPELARDSLRAMCLMAKFNQGAAYSPGERRRILKKLLGAIGEGTEIRPPLYCDYGYQIQIGAWTFVNFGLHLSSRRVSSSRRRKLIGQLPMPSLGCSQWHHPPAQEEGGSRQRAEGYAWLRSPWMSPSPGDVLILEHVVVGGGRFECDSEVRRI